MLLNISVIIVSYNSEDFIEKCILSVLKFLPEGGEIVVIDNASTDNTQQVLSKLKIKSENLKVIENKTNLGFAKANNLAEKGSRGKYLFFLNPDTELDDSIGSMLEFYEKTPNAGIVAPKLVMANGQVQPSVRKLPTILGAFKEHILGMKNEYSEYTPRAYGPMEVEMVYGAAMLMKKDLFEKLRGFNEKYFLYYEDVDLCKRVRESGKKIYYDPEVRVKHLVGATKSGIDKYQLNLESARIYHGLVGSFILQAIFLIHRLLKGF